MRNKTDICVSPECEAEESTTNFVFVGFALISKKAAHLFIFIDCAVLKTASVV
jgi:hypothetical protein